MTIEKRLHDLGEPPSSIKYLAEHPEHVPATPPQPINPPSAETGD